MDEIMVLEKLRNLEARVDALCEGRHKDQLDIMLQKQEIKGIKDDMVELKTDIVSIVAAQTAKTWDLINRGGKLVFGLVIVITILAGAKMLPELLKFLM